MVKIPGRLAIMSLLLCGSASAQWRNVPPAAMPRTPDGKPNLSAAAPRLPDGKPDLSGIWSAPMGANLNLARELKEGAPFQPWAKSIYQERSTGAHWKDDPDANCLPQGLPKILLVPPPWRIIQTPDIVFFIHEAFNLWWQAFLDGREFSSQQDITPTWLGYSTGKWEGDTLVIDSRGFNGKMWLDQQGKPTTDALHVTMRFHRKDFGHMDIGITIDDSKAYTRPWGTTVEVTLLPEAQLMEFICLENERDTRNK